jgi:hypothetical protein
MNKLLSFDYYALLNKLPTVLREHARIALKYELIARFLPCELCFGGNRATCWGSETDLALEKMCELVAEAEKLWPNVRHPASSAVHWGGVPQWELTSEQLAYQAVFELLGIYPTDGLSNFGELRGSDIQERRFFEAVAKL